MPSNAQTALLPEALDKPRPSSAQASEPPGAGAHDEVAIRRSHLRVRTLVSLRWLVIAGEVLLLLVVGLGLGFPAPYPMCFAVIGAAAWLNLITGLVSPGQRMFGDWEGAGQLALDVAQIAALVFLTGGTSNPFVLLLIAPVTLAAATLPARAVLALGFLAAASALALAFYSMPLPGGGHAEDQSYRIGAAIAVWAGIALIAGYVRQAAEEAVA